MRDRAASCEAGPVTTRCLLVDDNERFLRVARDVLEREGIAVVGIATNSAEALARAGELRPDVTLVDIDLGGESGFDLAHRLAEAGPGGRPHVIFVSAHDEDDFRDAIAASRSLGFLPKEELSGNMIRALLESAGTET